MSRIPGYNYDASYQSGSSQKSRDSQKITSWGKEVPVQGSSNWSNQPPQSLFGESLKYPPQIPHRESENPYQWNNDTQVRPTFSVTQGSEWQNANIQQGIRQNLQTQSGNFGTDSVFNDTDRTGKRIPNIGFSNPQNNTLHTNKVGQGMNMGIFGNLLPTLFPNPCTKYKILACVDTSKALDVTSITDEKKKLRKGTMIIWQYHGGPNQQFYILPGANGKVRIINAASGYSMQVPNNETKDGAHLLVNPNCNTQNEQFQLIEYTKDKRQKDIYQIKTFCGKVLDCENQRQSNGTRVIQWTANNGKNQLWKITPA